MKVKVNQSYPTLWDPMDYTVHGILQARIPRVGSLSFFQGIFPTQGSNPGLLHCRRILCQLSHKGKPRWFIGVCIYSPSWNKQKETESDINAYILIFILFPCIFLTYYVSEIEEGMEYTAMRQAELLSSLKSGARDCNGNYRKQTWATMSTYGPCPSRTDELVTEHRGNTFIYTILFLY